jgi:glycosyltransferase involved in cell wall biosynthesis
MKIAFIGQKGIPAKFGGVEKHVDDLAVHLAQAGHDVYVYTRANYTENDLHQYKGVNLISLPSIPTKHLDAISHTFLACFDAYRREYDLIHFHSIGPSSLILLMKFLRPNLPIVATFHSMCYHHKKWNWLAKLYLQVGEFMLCNFADKVITISEILKKYVKDVYSVNSACIPNGVVIRDQKEAQEIIKWGLEKDSYLLLVSRFIPHKGIHYAISAYQELNTDKKLVIAGDGVFTDKYVNELKELAGNDSNIIFTGNQTGNALAELYSNAYLFIQPSEQEGLSIALLEAMSYKKAVLASDIPENYEALGDAGFYFRTKDVDDLKEKLDNLLCMPDLVDIKAREAKIRVKEYFGWAGITEKIIKIYEMEIVNYRNSVFIFLRLRMLKDLFLKIVRSINRVLQVKSRTLFNVLFVK